MKIQNHPRRLFMPLSIHTYQKYLNPSGDPVPLNENIQQLKVPLFSFSGYFSSPECGSGPGLLMRIRMQPTFCKSGSNKTQLEEGLGQYVEFLNSIRYRTLQGWTHLPGQSSTCSSITKSGISCLQSGHRLWLNNTKIKKNYQQTSVVDPEPVWIRIQGATPHKNLKQ